MTLNSIIKEDLLSKDIIFRLNSQSKKITDAEGIIEQLSLLNLHGIATPFTKEYGKIKKLSYRDIYLVSVFQQKVLAYYKQTNNTSAGNWINSSIVKKNKIYLNKVNSFKSKRDEKRIRELAIRAIYALNLDYGIVKIGVTGGAKPWVLFVNSTPDANNEVNDLFTEAISNFENKWSSPIDSVTKEVILGADPEFVIQGKDGRLIMASKYLPKNGQAGCDRIWTNNDRSQLPLAELRPTPSSEPSKLILNLYNSMLIANKKINSRNIKWLAGAMPIPGYPIGGHIHFSNIWLNSFLLRALDNYLTLSLILLEDANGRNRRPKYGFLGDYRAQFHGGFEYRTLPSWLVSPKITKGVIALAKLIAENYRSLGQNPLQNSDVQKAYYRGDKSVLRPIVLNLWKELKQLSDFKLYEKYLLPLEELIKYGYSWEEANDIRIAWRLINQKSNHKT